MTSPINPTVASYLSIKPVMQSMKTLNDQLPKNSLPVDSMGTIQSSAEQIAHPQLSIYNAHGIVTPNSPNTLLVHA